MMRIVVPVGKQEDMRSEIVNMKEATSFAMIDLAEGMVVERLAFLDSFSNELFDYIIVSDKNEDVEEAFELGARALLARHGMSLEEIVEALMFRELDEIC